MIYVTVDNSITGCIALNRRKRVEKLLTFVRPRVNLFKFIALLWQSYSSILFEIPHSVQLNIARTHTDILREVNKTI